MGTPQWNLPLVHLILKQYTRFTRKYTPKYPRTLSWYSYPSREQEQSGMNSSDQWTVNSAGGNTWPDVRFFFCCCPRLRSPLFHLRNTLKKYLEKYFEKYSTQLEKIHLLLLLHLRSKDIAGFFTWGEEVPALNLRRTWAHLQLQLLGFIASPYSAERFPPSLNWDQPISAYKVAC